MTSHWKVAFLTFFSGLFAFISYVATLPPEAQTGFVEAMVSLFPPQWRGQIGVAMRGLSTIFLMYGAFRAAKSGPGGKDVAVKLLVFGAILLGCTGCSPALGTTVKSRAAAVGKTSLTAVEHLAAGVAERAAINTAAQLVSGQAVTMKDLEAAGAQGLWTQVFSVQSAGDLANVFNAFTANKVPEVAKSLSAAYSAAAPATPADKQAVVNAIAAGVMTAAAK